jgi:3-carboxy-cis,cis-muconate cycloisomerase
MLQATSDRAWLSAMLRVEAALARVESRLRLVPQNAADSIEAACVAERYDVALIGVDAAESANPVVPLVRALKAEVGEEAAPFVHLGATSQDILDTAMMLIARDGLGLMTTDLDRAAEAAAGLAEKHRSALMAARTLMQQALPTTFGLKAAGWLTSIAEARFELDRLRRTRLAVQFGGAAGTLASLEDRGLEVATQLAAELHLQEPVGPWHTHRARVVEIANALGMAASVAAKIALDVILMAQTEVAEVAEAAREGKGESSTLPQKHNPVESVAILAAARGVNAQVGLLQQAMVQEHERAAGAWQAEWPALCEALRLAAGSVSRLADVLSGLNVDTARMRQNLDASGGLVMAESVVMALSKQLDSVSARQLVERLVKASGSSGKSFDRLLREDREITSKLDGAALAAALEPGNYLGAAEQLIDRALEAYQTGRRKEHD